MVEASPFICLVVPLDDCFERTETFFVARGPLGLCGGFGVCGCFNRASEIVHFLGDNRFAACPSRVSAGCMFVLYVCQLFDEVLRHVASEADDTEGVALLADEDDFNDDLLLLSEIDGAEVVCAVELVAFAIAVGQFFGLLEVLCVGRWVFGGEYLYAFYLANQSVSLFIVFHFVQLQDALHHEWANSVAGEAAIFVVVETHILRCEVALLLSQCRKGESNDEKQREQDLSHSRWVLGLCFLFFGKGVGGCGGVEHIADFGQSSIESIKCFFGMLIGIGITGRVVVPGLVGLFGLAEGGLCGRSQYGYDGHGGCCSEEWSQARGHGDALCLDHHFLFGLGGALTDAFEHSAVEVIAKGLFVGGCLFVHEQRLILREVFGQHILAEECAENILLLGSRIGFPVAFQQLFDVFVVHNRVVEILE